jgi:hypothetical protein
VEVVAVTINELIDALGRAPSGTDVFVRFQGVAFKIERVRVEYVGGDGWAVELDPDLHTTQSAR